MRLVSAYRSSSDIPRRCTSRRGPRSRQKRRARCFQRLPEWRLWTSAAQGGTPQRLPRQRTATQFMSEEYVKICPPTGDLTYGLSPTTYARVLQRTVCRSQRFWFGSICNVYCRPLGGLAECSPLTCFFKRFYPLIPSGCRDD